MQNNPSPAGEKILEGNKGIRKFMDHGHMAIRIQYDSSWSDLMPVVEKIGQSHNIRIQVGLCSITRRYMSHKKYMKERGVEFDEVPPIAECDGKGFIDNVWHAVVDFITWYNQQTPSNGK